VRKRRRGSEELHSSTDEEDSDTDYSIDYDVDNTASTDDLTGPASSSSQQQNGVCTESSRPADGLANNVKGPCFW